MPRIWAQVSCKTDITTESLSAYHSHMVAELVEVSAEQRNLPPAAHKNADGSRRAAGRIIALMDESLISLGMFRRPEGVLPRDEG